MSAYATVNGFSVITGTLSRPRSGPWTAELQLDLADSSKVAGAVTLNLGGLVFAGTTLRAGVHHDRTHLRIRGGAGGLAKQLPAKAYRGVSLGLVLRDVLAAGGERLAASSDAGVLATSLPFWQRRAGSVAEAVLALLAGAGAPTWRVLADGSVWVGSETWTAAALKAFDELEVEPAIGRVTIGTSDAPDVGPGQTLDGRRVSRVEHVIQPDAIRHHLWLEDGVPGPVDRVKAPLLAFVMSLLSRLDYFARYPSKVVAQNGDGTLELVPDDPKMPGMSGVPIRYGVPGVKATVAPGARVLLGFAGGDPSKPEAELWESATVLELDVTATLVKVQATNAQVTASAELDLTGLLVKLNGGVLPIARATDPVQAGPFAGTIIGPGNVTVLG